MNIFIGKDKSLQAFGRRFVAEAKSLAQLCSLTPWELATVLVRAIKPLPYLDIFQSKLIGPIDSEKVLRIAEALFNYKSLGNSYSTQPTKVFHTENDDKDKTEIYYNLTQNLKGVCHYCGKEGHWMRTWPKLKKDQGGKMSQSEVHRVGNDSSDEETPKKA